MRSSLEHRCREVELLDAGHAPADGIRENLEDLRFYNSWFGGTRRLIREIEGFPVRGGAGGSLKVLDVGTGSADIPARLVRWGRSRGVEMLAGGLDSNPVILSEARRHLTSNGGCSVKLVRADARCLPFADDGVDLVVCSNFLHHMDSHDARVVLAEMARVSRLGFIVVDLVRSWIALGLVWTLTRLTSTNSVTRNDGTLSVRRAFTAKELKDLAREAGLPDAQVRRVGPVRMVLTHQP